MTLQEKHNNEISFDDIARVAKETILRDGKHIPALIIEGTKKAVFRSIPVFPGTAQFMHVVGRQEAKSGEVGDIRQVFFISEGWMSLPKDREISKIIPSQDPNRKEVLVVSRLKIQGQVKNIKLFELIRNDHGKLVDIQEFLPSTKESERAYIPFLEAFCEGFQNTFRERLN